MTVLTLTGDYNDPWLECSECDMRFQLFWNRNPLYQSAGFCPFCGDEVSNFVDEMEGGR